MTKALIEAASLYNDPRFLSKSELRIYENKKRRLRIVRRQKMALALFVTAVIFLLLFFRNSIKLEAQNENYIPKCKYYKVVTVHAGDNLSSIAGRFYDSQEYEDLEHFVSEICSINQLNDPDVIKAGESIVVPYYDEYK
ncbi:LysM peptidoglycan-binding domain-containing protein [Butyrivibrio sp. XBB1001]|uniref:LysM peptidoglycan-binding domain-containing protein n=1 Tax=Butyrivibrio sp. XBB1001 TaxID=1280682 RepID=UPI00040003AA|nr:LysM domain-containing protein [Butyrivibrio sp. XBB1001]